jgi:hypothetical protein
VDKLYVSVGWNPDIVPTEAVDYEKEILSKFPEVKSYFNERLTLPEAANNMIVPTIEEECIMLTESDNWIFGKGFVDECFKDIETGFDIVAGECTIFFDNLVSKLKHQAFMRSMMFVKRDLLKMTDINFYPAKAKDSCVQRGFETFGWLSYQLSMLGPKIRWIAPNTFSPGNEFQLDYKTYPYFHIRGMSSTTIGMGSEGYQHFLNKDIEQYKKITQPGSHQEWGFSKVVIFKQILLEEFKDKDRLLELYEQYKNLLERVVVELNLPRTRIEEHKKFFKGLLNND